MFRVILNLGARFGFVAGSRSNLRGHAARSATVLLCRKFGHAISKGRSAQVLHLSGGEVAVYRGCRACGQKFDIDDKPVGHPLGISCLSDGPMHKGPFDPLTVEQPSKNTASV
jgi:hypothetical protein